jgi:ABC-type enterobactin transport system permease subunit
MDTITAAVAPIADRIVAALQPRMSEIVRNASETAEPVVKRVVVESVLPALLVSLVAGAAIAAAIGSHFASRRSGVRRNPAGWPFVPMRRRVAA